MSTLIQTVFGVVFLVSAGGFFLGLCQRLNASPVPWRETHLLLAALLVVSLICVTGRDAISNSGVWILASFAGNVQAIGLLFFLVLVLLSWLTFPVVAGAVVGQLTARLCRKGVNRS